MRSPERKALLRFVSVFIALNTIFLLIISIIYYQYQKTLFTDIQRDAMVYYSGIVQDDIFNSKNIEELHHHLSQDPRFEIAFLDKEKHIVYRSLPTLTFPYQKGFFDYLGHHFYIESIGLEHLQNIHYLVIRSNTIDDQLEQTRHSIYLFLVFSILFLSVVIYALSKLFLHPVRDTISKLDHFIRDTTHELNTPLSVIKMSIEQIAKNDLPAPSYKHIERIDVASRTLTNLYNDLTFLLMYEQTKSHNIEIDFLELANERIEYFRPIADAKKITIHTDFVQTRHCIDRDKISRLIDNLLSNAIKYNRASGDIYITLSPDLLQIRDTGIGISDEAMNKIFTRYSRFDNANGGFGIGLHIVQMICEEYGLKIDVKSEVGVGTAFTITWEEFSL